MNDDEDGDDDDYNVENHYTEGAPVGSMRCLALNPTPLNLTASSVPRR